MNIVVVPSSSKNPVKLNAVSRAFKQVFPEEKYSFISVDVPSNVAAQPMTDSETFLGAKNRAVNARDKIPEANFWLGLEGGIKEVENKLYCFNWVYILEASGKESFADSGMFRLPEDISAKVSAGEELGAVSQDFFNVLNIKHSTGTVGALSNGIIDRESFFYHATILALIPFMHPKYYL